MTKTSTALLLLALTSLLAGCTTNPNVLQIHKVTAEAIGLASTDELTMGPVTKSKEDFLGGAELNFKATTAKGRVVNCSTVNNPNYCILSITMDQDRKVVGFEADAGKPLLPSGYQSVKFGPPSPSTLMLANKKRSLPTSFSPTKDRPRQ